MRDLMTLQNEHGQAFLARWEHVEGDWLLHLWHLGELPQPDSGWWVGAHLAHKFRPVRPLLAPCVAHG